MVDLHLHLDGSLEPADIIELAEIGRVELPSYEEGELRALLTVDKGCTSLGEYLEKFDLPLKVLQSKACISRAVYLLIRRLFNQGLCYAEIRFAPQLHINGGLSQEEVTKAAVSGLFAATSEFNFKAQLILCCMRLPDNELLNIDTVYAASKFLGNGVCAIDLAGNEAAFPTCDYAKLFDLAKKLSVPFIIHAGEASGAKSVLDALSFGAKRIGHGIRAIECFDAVLSLAYNKIPVEVCFTSNLQTKAASSPSAHPVKEFFKKGVAVTLNTDNMTVSGTSLKAEYRAVGSCFGFSLDDLQEMALNSVNAAFLNDFEKAELALVIKDNFKAWYLA